MKIGLIVYWLLISLVSAPAEGGKVNESDKIINKTTNIERTVNYD